MLNELKKQLEVSSELLAVLNDVFLFIGKINLKNNKIAILQDRIGMEYPYNDDDWDKHLEYYSSFILEQEREMIKYNLSQKNLLNLLKIKQKTFYVTLPYVSKLNQIKWLGATVNFLINNKEGDIAYLMIHEPNENLLLRDIVNLYVYNNCDYFIYLDAKKNNYTMFCGSSNGTPLPPAICNDYNTEIVKYADAFVVPEDRDMVIKKMTLEVVLKNLDEKEEHSFMCGIIDPVRGYTRKKLTYRYYNKENQMILLSRTDITDIYNQEQEYIRNIKEALEKTHRDSMTGLLNVEGIRERISYFLSMMNKESFSALMFVDLDNFKKINDTFGHSKGDEVLCKVANVLSHETRMDDLVARIGGDEFLIFLKDIKSVKNAEIYAERICNGIEKISEELNISIPTSCSIGISFTPNDGNDYKTLIAKADKLVYKAKHQGKNQFSREL